MEEWQCIHITQNLSALIFQTSFNSAVKAKLQELNILSQSDIDSLDAVEKLSGISEASRQYYRSLTGRINAYKVLTKALLENHQTGAVRILIEGVPSHVSNKPLTYLGIPIKLDGFTDMEIEIHGNKSTLHKFLPTVDPLKLHQIFQETVSELEIFDTFVLKQKTFILANSTVPPKPTYYVPRFLSNRIKIHEFIFKADCPDVFVFKKTMARYKLSQVAKPHFTDTSASQLSNITSRFIYLDEDEDWNELKKMAKAPIHLINYEVGRDIYLLEDSSEPSDILRKLDSKEERVYMSEEEFVQQELSEYCASSSVCICDTPGMGKTFLLANIARLMTDKCDGRIVVFVQLTSFVQACFPASPTTTVDPETSLINLLSCICPNGQNSELLHKLVKAELLRLEVFFDGFDEIPIQKDEWTKQVFRSITTNFPNTRIYITSRPHMRQDLEQSLGVVAYDILPFNKQNQITFLVQFWQNSKSNSDKLSLQSYATNCLKSVDESLTKNEKEIAGIPLLCQLIAEVFSDEVLFQSINRRKLSDFPFQISGMYEKFVKKKIQLVAKDKNEFENIKLVLMWHALKLLFRTDGFHEDKQFKNVIDLLTSPEMLRVGILQKHSGALEFIHRTFAEYLAADYFFTKLLEMQKTEEMNCDSMFILKLLLNCQKTELQYTNYHAYGFFHPVIVSFFNSALLKDQISEELKIHAAAFVSSIYHEDFINILCSCCQQNLLNLFGLLTHSLKKWEKSRILECFTNGSSYELIEVCIRKSTSQLFQKCIRLLAEELKLDLEQINTQDNNSTLLQIAVQRVNYEAVEYFVDRISIKNQSLLESCVRYSFVKDDIERRVNILHLLLNKDPTLINETPNILLTYGIDVRLFKILVKFGANLTAADNAGYNCAMSAAQHMSPTDYRELVQFLLTDCKAEYLFLHNEKSKDPLKRIIQRATLLPETLELLLNIPGIDINMKDINGENLLFSAAEGDKLHNLQQLVDRGLDYNARTKENRSLLHVAAWRNERVEMVRYLLSLKLDPNSRDENEWTPLHYAAEYSDSLSVVEVLVENGANVQAKNNKGQTALQFSIFTPKLEIIKYLIVKGAQVNDRDNEGNTPLHLCKRKKAMECLVKMGVDIHAKNNEGQTALHISASSRLADKEVIKYLIGTGVGVNDRDNNGNTPLHLCEMREIIDYLIKMGADIHATNNNGQTILHTLVQNFYPDKQAIKYLIGNGVGVNDRDIDGNTPLHLCEENDAKNCLIEMRADIHAKNKKGQNPAQMNPDLWN